MAISEILASGIGFIQNKDILPQLPTILDTLPGHVLWKNQESKYLLGSNKLAKLLGYKHAEELVGVADSDLPCDAAEHAEYFVQQDKEVMLSGNTMATVNIFNYCDANAKVLLGIKSPLKDTEGNVLGTSCYSFDLAEHPCVFSRIIRMTSQDIHAQQTNTTYTLQMSGNDSAIALSNREFECLYYLIRGYSWTQIATRLGLSPRTVETYVDNLKNKFGALNKVELIEKAIDMGYAQRIPSSICQLDALLREL